MVIKVKGQKENRKEIKKELERIYMMGILGDLQPKSVFQYFEEICRIPHGSSDTKAISDYCVNFAKERRLRFIQDKDNNVIIFKNGTPGYEELPSVIIQGHLDMVCEKDSECDIDFKKEGLKLAVKDGYVYAEGTTLGADDGIAVAFALAVLASEDILHPPLEVVLTVDEEIGMLGAAEIDCKELKSNIMLNLDSEEEGYLLVSCAGGVTVTCHMPVSYTQCSGKQIRLQVTGLQGGHSGVEIDKGRANANQILGRILYALKSDIPFELKSVNGGLKDNAIPREAYADIVICDKQEEKSSSENNGGNISLQKLQAFLKKYNEILANEYHLTDKEIEVQIIDMTDSDGKEKVFDEKTSNAVIAALVNLPGGIQKMSRDIEGLVQTSLNLGILKTEENEVSMSLAVRSSVKSEKEELFSRIKCLMTLLGGSVTTAGDYPAWEYKKDSKLRDLMVQIYEEQYGEKPVIQAIHAGVECGLFAGKIEGLDCVSFGPNILDIHTPKERMEIESVSRIWDYVVEILRRMKDFS